MRVFLLVVVACAGAPREVRPQAAPLSRVAPASVQQASGRGRVPPEQRTTFSLSDTSGMSPAMRDIVRIEHRRSVAIARNDSTTLRRIYAADFRGVTAAGTEVNRERLLAVFASDDGASRFTMDSISVRVLRGRGPRIAISSERLSTFDSAGVLQNRTWLMHVYQWRDGRWQIVAAQGTLIR